MMSVAIIVSLAIPVLLAVATLGGTPEEQKVAVKVSPRRRS
jgi:hypothetical protein